MDAHEQSDDTGACFKCGQCSFTGHSRLSLSMHVTQVHSPNVRICTRSRCVEAELYRQLKLLAPSRRRELLDHFSQGQRLALERWILAQKHQKQRRQLKHAAVGVLAAKPDANEGAAGGTHTAEASQCCQKRSLKPKIFRRAVGEIACRRSIYSAQARAGPFTLFTKAVPDMATAVTFAEVLTAIQQEVTCQDLQTFERAMKEVPVKLGHDVQSMGLSFAATIPAKHWVGRELWTPRFAWHQLQYGLNAWRRLHSARARVHCGRANRYSFLRNSKAQLEKAWMQLRHEYINVWAEAGKDRRALDMKLLHLELRCNSKRSCLRTPSGKRRQQRRMMLSSGLPLLREEGNRDSAKDVESLLHCWSRVSGRKRRRLADWSSTRTQKQF